MKNIIIIIFVTLAGCTTTREPQTDLEIFQELSRQHPEMTSEQIEDLMFRDSMSSDTLN